MRALSNSKIIAEYIFIVEAFLKFSVVSGTFFLKKGNLEDVSAVAP